MTRRILHERPGSAGGPHVLDACLQDRPSSRRMTYLRLLAQSSLVTVAPLAHGQGVLPGEATLVSGDAAIATSGPAMTITQSSDKAILDWTDFSIGQDNTVTFLNGSGTTLNRVTGTSLSSLDGLLSATGTIYLINPNGIVVGQNGIVDVGGSFIAATHDVDTAAFLAGGDLDFSGVSDASIINLGKIAAAQGDVFLIAREVTNAGTLEAAQGTAGMAAGYDVLLTDGSLGDGKLQVRVGGAGTSATTRGEIEAASVELRANGGNIYALAGNTGGTIRATGVSHSDGRIFLTAGDGKVTVAGGVTLAASRGAASTLPASAAGSADAPGMQALSAASGMDGSVSDTGSLLLAPSQAMSGTGGDVILSGGKVSVSGEIAATGTEGGSVTITGTDIAVVGGRIDASGETGGGTVRIGGNKHGAPGLQTAYTLYFDADSLVRADATRSGNGGQVVLWAEDATSFAGNISARGAGSGTGGDAEVSGKAFLDYTGRTNLRGPGGAGTLLLDPYNLTISDENSNSRIIVRGSADTEFEVSFQPISPPSVIDSATVEEALSMGNVHIFTNDGGSENGDIIVNSSISWSTESLLTLTAHGDIIVNQSISSDNGGGLALEYGQGAIAAGNTADYYVNAAINLTSDGSFSTKLGSDGTVIDYTIITSLGSQSSVTPTDLQGINGTWDGTSVSGYYVLGADIDASATVGWNDGGGFSPLGNGEYFEGIFDGLGHTISNLVIDHYTTSPLGLFNELAEFSEIRNLGLVDGFMNGSDLVGGLVGENHGTLFNVFVTGDAGGNSVIGGLAAINYGTITDAYVTGNVSGGVYAGGLVGFHYGDISNAFASSDVGDTLNAGGLIALNDGNVTNAYATGDVTGSDNAGGLIVSNYGSVSNTYATGLVTGRINSGGLIGFLGDSASVTNSFYNTETSGQSDTGKGTGLTTTEMQTMSTFVDAGWDIDDEGGTGSAWRIYDGDTAPLVRSLLTQLTLSTVYDGSGAALTDIGAYDVPDGADASLILGIQTGNTLTLTSRRIDDYTASIDITGLYSTQLGYDLLGGSRIISTPGSEAGEIDLSNGVTWTNGKLVIDDDVTNAGIISSTNGVFELTGGAWSQTGTLADFDVFDFRLSGGTFLRSTFGDGSEAAYTLIDVYGLQGADTLPDSVFMLGDDIDASGTVNWWDGLGFDPIGDASQAFTGKFYGEGHVISGLFIDRPTQEYVSLFGVNDGVVESVGIAGGSVTGNSFVGGVVGENQGTLTDAYNSGDVTSSSVGGGLAGLNYGTISDAYATGDVKGGSYAGGLVGVNYGDLTNVFATGDATDTVIAGGLTATNHGNITNAYATGDAIATAYAGGLTAYNYGDIVNSYATGALAGVVDTGGLVAFQVDSASVTNSFYNTETTGQSDTGKGTGLTTEEIQSLSTFTDAGWDIDDEGGTGAVWRIYDGDTAPLLRSFLTQLTLTTAYDGSGSALTDIGAYELPDGADASLVLGSQIANTLTLTSTDADGYTASIDISGLYSSQFGYDLQGGSRTISTPGSAAGDIDLSSGVTWTDGTLIINGNVTDAGVISSTNGVFELAGGSWSQTGTLADFDVFDFRLSGGTFLRAASGDGSEADPYTLTDVYGLQGMDTLRNSDFALANDIDASGTVNWWDGLGFDPIAQRGIAFSGNFDGRNHTISGLTIDRPTEDFVGLISDSDGTIENLGLVDVSVTGDDHVGGLVGRHYGNVSSIYVSGQVTGDTYVGGLIGRIGANTISNVFSTSDVTGTLYVGGLAGSNSGTITNAYATGDVTGRLFLGGLVGENQYIISNSYATGAVSGEESSTGRVGGLVGYKGPASSITNSFYDTETTGQSDSGKGTRLTTEEIQSLSTFTDAGWDIDDEGGTGAVWRIYDGDTAPLLRSFLTPLSLSTAYDGSGAALTDIGAYELPDGADASLVLGTQTGNTLTLTSTVDDSYTASIDISGLYSTQFGYDLSGSRTISTPGSAAGDIDLSSGVTWTDGTLVINGNVIDAGVISSTNGVFELAGGSWSQTGTLADFDVFDFRLSGGTFLRATSGDGSEADPYTLIDIYGLQGVDTLVSASFALDADIDASGTVNWWDGAGFDPIGDASQVFTGHFDGQDHIISGLVIDRPTQEYAGLFGVSRGVIENVGLVGGSVTGSLFVGGVVGSNQGTISNTYNTGDVTGSTVGGGLAGLNYGMISDSYATGDVIGGSYAGGLVGINYADLANVFATGNATDSVIAGGLTATNHGTITNAYATGDAIATGYGAGLVTYNYGEILNTYATGAVTGLSETGGLVAFQTGSASVTNSFYNTETSGQNDTGKGIGLTTEEMTDPFTFIDAGWDFESDWGKSVIGQNGGYMMLRSINPDYLYDDYVRLSGDTTKTYGDANPSLDGITLDGVGTDNVTLSWGSGISETTGAGYYAYAGDAGNVEVSAADDRFVYVDYGSDGLTISKASLTVTANDDSKTYDGQTYSGNNGVSYDGFVNSDDTSILGGILAFAGSAQGAKDAGTYTIEASGLTADNYNITYVDGLLSVAKASLTITAVDDSKTYDGLSYAGGNGVSYDGFVSGEDESVLGGSLAYGGTAQGAKDAGDYVIAASGLTSGNYDISYVDGSLDVEKASLIITAADDSKTYDGITYAGGNGVSYDGFVDGEDSSVLGGTLTYDGDAQGARDAGTYVITASGLTSGNYDITYLDGALDVARRAITILADAQTKIYGEVDPDLTYTIGGSGLAEGDTEAGVLSGALARTAGETVNGGPYAIGQGSLGANANYTLTYVGNDLTITPAALTVTADDQSKIVDGAVFEGPYTVTLTGLTGGDDASVLGAIDFGGDAISAVHAGSYQIIPGGAANPNYTITFVNGTLTLLAPTSPVDWPQEDPSIDELTDTGTLEFEPTDPSRSEDDTLNKTDMNPCGNGEDGKDCSNMPHPLNQMVDDRIRFTP